MDQQEDYDVIDRFKLQLGLPANLPIELDDSPLRPLTQQFRRYDEVFQQLAAVSKEVIRLASAESAAVLRAALRKLLTTAEITKGTRFRTDIVGRWSLWERRSVPELKDRLSQQAEER